MTQFQEFTLNYAKIMKARDYEDFYSILDDNQKENHKNIHVMYDFITEIDYNLDNAPSLIHKYLN